MRIQRKGSRRSFVGRAFKTIVWRNLPVKGICWLVLGGLYLRGPVMAATDPKDTGRDRAHYSADQPVEFKHMRLRLTFTAEGLKARTCEGRVEYTLQPRAKKIDWVRLDAVDMQIIGVEFPGQTRPATFSYDDKVITIQLPKAVKPDEAINLAVEYRLEEPRKGMHFVLPNA